MKIVHKAFLVLLVLILVSAVFASMSFSSAHDPPWTIPTYAYINVAPNPVGVGQTAYLGFWLDKVPPTATGREYGTRWHDMTVEVTKPDGTTETLGPYDSDAVGGAWASYTPEQIGTYKFVFKYPGQVAQIENPYPYRNASLMVVPLGDAFINDTYTGSTSEPAFLTVQQDPVETAYSAQALPSEYWSRPINSMNREWASIGGNWLGLGVTSFGLNGMYDNNGNFNPYTQAPNSAHVVWTKPIAFGGQVGGEFGESETGLYATGTAYEAKFGPVIMYGVLYYTEYPGAMNNPSGLKAVDLRTGETIWTKNVTTPLRAGMIYNLITGDQYGAHAYLFCAPGRQGFINPTTTHWEMYDAMTGNWILNIANATPGTLVRGPNGELLSYIVAQGKLTMWNSTRCINAGAQKNLVFQIYSADEIWRPPQGFTIDWSAGNQWSVPIATEVSGVLIVPGLSVTHVADDVVLATAQDSIYTGGPPGGSQTGWRVDAAYNAKTGELLWGPVNRTLSPFTNVPMGPAGEGVYTTYECQTMTWTGYSLTTGEQLWGPTKPYNNTLGYYDYNAKGVIGYGNLYTYSLNGEVHCYDLQTGNEEWGWYAGSAGVDSPYGTWPLGTWQTHHVLADGKLYVRAGHDYTPPVFKGAKLYCIDANTGQELWSSLSFDIVSGPACADGYMVWFNGYDNQIYCYGKGLSATTVTASPGVGNTVTIQGTVTDQSPGQTCTGIPAKGTPAISDADQSAWMEYLYQQQPKPTNAKGVDVKLTATDAEGNTFDIGTITSDANGNFGISWTPPAQSTYHITAVFEGTNSYYGSQATTYMSVGAGTNGAATVGTDSSVIIGVAAVALIVAVIAIIFAARKRT